MCARAKERENGSGGTGDKESDAAVGRVVAEPGTTIDHGLVGVSARAEVAGFDVLLGFAGSREGLCPLWVRVSLQLVVEQVDGR